MKAIKLLGTTLLSITLLISILGIRNKIKDSNGIDNNQQYIDQIETLYHSKESQFKTLVEIINSIDTCKPYISLSYYNRILSYRHFGANENIETTDFPNNCSSNLSNYSVEYFKSTFRVCKLKSISRSEIKGQNRVTFSFDIRTYPSTRRIQLIYAENHQKEKSEISGWLLWTYPINHNFYIEAVKNSR